MGPSSSAVIKGWLMVVEIYQGNDVAPAKDFMLSAAPTSIPITRWAFRKGKPYLYVISDFIGEAKEAS